MKYTNESQFFFFFFFLVGCCLDRGRGVGDTVFATLLPIPCLRVQCKHNEYFHLHNEYVPLQCVWPSPSAWNQASAIVRAQQTYEELPIGYPVQVDEGSIDLPATREQ